MTAIFPVIQTAEDIQREIDERIDSWNIPEGMSLDEFIDRVNNGELEQIREEQGKSTLNSAEKSAETVDKSEKSGIIEVGKEVSNGRSSGTGEDFVDNWYEEVGKIDVSDREQIDKVLSDFERKHQDSPEEHCVVITKTGVIYEVHGSKWSVDTTLLGDRMNDSINKHNHVTGESQYSFSYQDIFSSALDGSKESWAFDEKYEYLTVFSKNVDGNDVYNAYENATLNVLERKLNGEYISDEDEQHEIVKATCSELGIEYERWLR